MNVHVFQLRAGADLKTSISEFVEKNSIGAGYLLTCVSGLSQAALRMPGTKELKVIKGDMKIVSAQGAVAPDGCRIHVAIADPTGAVIGGQLMDGCIVRNTAEIAIIEDMDRTFSREMSPDIGHKELVIRKKVSATRMAPASSISTVSQLPTTPVIAPPTGAVVSASPA